MPSGKDDSSLIYAFYSVHETKKKSGGWIYHGSKEKSLGFGYNIVGQMKISSSYHAEISGPEKDLYVVRESVLYSTDAVQADQKTVDCTLNGELAAIIVKNPSDKTCGDIGSSISTVVILPEGVHSWPNSVLPFPIITDGDLVENVIVEAGTLVASFTFSVIKMKMSRLQVHLCFVLHQIVLTFVTRYLQLYFFMLCADRLDLCYQVLAALHQIILIEKV